MAKKDDDKKSDAKEEDGAKGGKKKKLMIIIGAVVAALVVGVGAFMMMSKPSGAEAAEKPPLVAGDVMVLEPISINLKDKHYLKLGISLQMVQGVKKVDGSKALDLAIKTFTMQKQDELHDTAYREKLREELNVAVKEAYEEKVMGVYLTEFVTQ